MAGVVKKMKFPRPGVEQTSQAQQFLAAEQQTLEREKEKKKIERLAQEKVQEIQTKTALEALQVASEWQQCSSPEGYAYYYNNNTGGITNSLKSSNTTHMASTDTYPLPSGFYIFCLKWILELFHFVSNFVFFHAIPTTQNLIFSV